VIGLLAAAALIPGAAHHAADARPIVYVQAGHEAPREPGYLAQTGAPGEIAFTRRVSTAVERKLRAAGVDARHSPGRVTPLAAPAAVFVSIHHDTAQGRAALAYALAGSGENYYHGQGWGVPRSTPYPDSAPHRPGTTISADVQARSRRLAVRMHTQYARVFTRANGARSGPVRMETPKGNPRMMRYYGFRRTNATARILIETGAAGTDAALLRRTDLIATAISQAIVRHLKAEGQLK